MTVPFRPLETTTNVIPIVDKTPGKRCSDYDEDCAHVPNPHVCWLGGTWNQWDQADGYCPRLIGME